MNDLNRFIDGLPKAELHLHIEGTFEPELLFAIAQRNSVSLPFESVEALRKAYDFGNLQDFLDIYYQGMNVLRTTQDFYDLTWAYLKRARADNVLHTEIFFDPQGHTSRGVDFSTVIDGIHRALVDGQAKLGISSRLIMCFLRHLSQEEAFATLEQAMDYRDRIIGIGLDSSELGHPPSKFTQVYAQAREAGFHLVAHAGEEGPAEYVREALDLLQVERIDHGNRSLDDAALVDRLVREQMPLTVCPLSNLKLQVVKDLQNHPLPRMLSLGLLATINSDDPAYFGGYVNANYRALVDTVGLNREQCVQLARNSFQASFLGEQEKQAYLQGVDEYVATA